jgi:hypothetical protein
MKTRPLDWLNDLADRDDPVLAAPLQELSSIPSQPGSGFPWKPPGKRLSESRPVVERTGGFERYRRADPWSSNRLPQSSASGCPTARSGTGTAGTKERYRATQSLPGQTDDGMGFAPSSKLKCEKRDHVRTRTEHAHLGRITTAILASRDFVKVAQP